MEKKVYKIPGNSGFIGLQDINNTTIDFCFRWGTKAERTTPRKLAVQYYSEKSVQSTLETIEVVADLKGNLWFFKYNS